MRPVCQTISPRGGPVELRLLQWNAGGLSQPKRLEIAKTLFSHDIDMFSIQEANLTEETLKFFPFVGYSLYLLPKSRQIASGILIGIKNQITAAFKVIKEMGNSEDKSEIVVVRLWKAGHPFTVYSLYIPPSSKPDLSNIDIDRRTILLGDFNAHSNRWGYDDTNAAGKEVEDLLNSSILELIYNPSDPKTFIHYNGTATNPDLLCVSADLSLSTEKMIIEDPGSGHRQTIATIRLQQTKSKPGVHKRTSWNFRKANWNLFTSLLEEDLVQRELDLSTHPSKLVGILCKSILDCAKRSIPRGKQKIYKCFWTSELKEIKEKRDRFRKKAELTGRAADVTAWRKQSAVFRKTLLAEKRKSFDTFISKLNYKEDSLKTYRFIANMQNRFSTPLKQPIYSDNQTLNNDNEIANAFGKFYANSQRKQQLARRLSKLHTKEWKKVELESREKTSRDLEVFEAPFSKLELLSALKCLKTGKSPGEDGIHADFLKHLGTLARESILVIFNYIWETGLVPSSWKMAHIIPILKKGKEASSLLNYRPISLTSTICKLMEKMVNNRLNWFLENFDKISCEQAGFRKNRSTFNQVTHFSQVIKDSLDKRHILTAVYIDFKSAYDSIWREKLLHKMFSIGIRSRMLHWFHSLLYQRNCRVRYGNCISKSYSLQTGLPQGAVSSCSLFNIYIEDLIQSLKAVPGVNCLLYADDLVFWTQMPKRNAKSAIELTLNRALNVLDTWSKENNMTINLTKTATQTFSLMHQNLKPSLYLQNTLLENVDTYTYLGVLFDSKLCWKQHVEYITDRITKRLSILKRLAGCLWGCARSTLVATYRTFILPVFTYCCESLITMPEYLMDKLEKIQNQALRLITGAVKSTPIDSMLLLTNIQPLRVVFEEKALILHEKLLHLNDAFWKDYQNLPRNLKTQNGFLQRVQGLRSNLHLPVTVDKILKPCNPLLAHEIRNYLDLQFPVLKYETAPKVLCALTLETLNNRFPEPEWLRVFTDGSFSNDQPNAGAGVYSKLFNFYSPIGSFRTAFDGEVSAIRIALKQLSVLHDKFQNAVILSDSRAAMQSICSVHCPSSGDVLDCQLTIKNLEQMGKAIVLQWVPAHCGLYGNEQADALAKRGTGVLQLIRNNVPFGTMKRLIKNKVSSRFYNEIRTRTASKIWGHLDQLSIPDYPRREAVAIFRLCTQHDCLPGHLYTIGVLSSPFCNLCGDHVIMDGHHITYCRALHGVSLVERYWEARGRLRQ